MTSKFDTLKTSEATQVEQRNFWNLKAAKFHKAGDTHSTAFAIGNKNKAIQNLVIIRDQLRELNLFGSATR